MGEIGNCDDVIDSRDVTERIEELESSAIDAWQEQTGADEEADIPVAFDAPAWLDIDERAELVALRALAADAVNEIGEWDHGATLIRETHWVDYVRELVGELVAGMSDLPGWVHVDWEATADEVLADYGSVDFDGVTYYGRM